MRTSLLVFISGRPKPLWRVSGEVFFCPGGASLKLGGTERTTMKKCVLAGLLLLGTVAAALGDGGMFSVKQYNLTHGVGSISAAESAMNNPSIWANSPVSELSPIIAFSYNLPSDRPAHFRGSMVPFPGDIPSSGCVVLKITGVITIPEAGYWTFACGSDDGFKATIGGYGTFSYSTGRYIDTSFKTFYFSNAGEYTLRLVYFNIGIEAEPPDAAALEFSMAKGSYSSFNSSAFSLVRASSGEEYHDIVFDANGGEGEMEAQVIVHGGKCTLSANAFFLNGYVFQGWATSTNGPVVYSDGAEITVDSDKTLYAVWKAEGGMIQLSVDRADPAAGSLTLAWEEEKSIEGVTYSVWRGRTGDERSAAVCVAPNVTGNTWTDEEYWKAEPVLEPLRYWVVADAGGKNERESNCVETRHRYGVFVGVGKYKNSNSPDPSDISNAELFAQLARGKGGFIVEAKDILTGSGAKKKAVRQAVQALAGKMQTGDYAVLFFSSHGDSTFWNRVGNKLDSDVKLNFASVAMYDGDYEKKEMASDLEMFMAGKNGVGVVVVLNSCLSGGAVDAVSADGQIAWITSCRDGEITPSWTATFGTPLPQFLLRYGWNRGRAGSGEFVTFGELADYALPELDAFLKKTLRSNHPVVKGEKVLAHFVAGRHGSAAHATVPTVPSGMNATTEEASLRVSWEGQSDADWFILQRSTVPETTQIAGVIEGTSEGGPDTSADLYGKSYFYRVAAMNEWGISGWSDSVTGSRHNPELVEWVKQQCGCDDSASPATLAAAAASTSANGASYEACYVTGIDPNDPSAAFKAELTREGGIWNVEPSGGRKAGRLYRVEGKKTMSDEVWTNVTGVEDLEAEGWHFFRVGVELAE